MDKANELKEKGNKEFQAGNYQKAVEFYSQAIDLRPDAVFLSNRAACYLGLKRYEDAAEDCARSIQLDPAFPKSYFRGAQALTQLGKLTEAFELIRKGIEKNPNEPNTRREYDNLQILMTYRSSLDNLIETGELPEALRKLNSLLEKCSHDISLIEKKIEVVCIMGEAKTALNFAKEKEALLRKRSPGLPQATYALIARYSNDLLGAKRYIQEAVRADPTLPEAVHGSRLIGVMENAKAKGNEAFTKKSYDEAIQWYDQAYEADPLNKHWRATILSNKASCLMGQGKKKEALVLVKMASDLDPTNDKHLYKRGKLEKDLGDWECAETCLKKAKTLNPSLTIDSELKEVAKKVKELNKKDYYAVLEVDKKATADEIKKKYKELARKWHPDKHAGNKEEQEKAEKKFKEISEANNVLSDPTKRQRYDISGADDGSEAYPGFSNMNDFFQGQDNPLIQMFFNSGSTNSFNFGGAGGRRGTGGGRGGGGGGSSRHAFFSQGMDDDIFSSMFANAKRR